MRSRCAGVTLRKPELCPIPAGNSATFRSVVHALGGPRQPCPSGTVLAAGKPPIPARYSARGYTVLAGFVTTPRCPGEPLESRGEHELPDARPLKPPAAGSTAPREITRARDLGRPARR